MVIAPCNSVAFVHFCKSNGKNILIIVMAERLKIDKPDGTGTRSWQG